MHPYFANTIRREIERVSLPSHNASAAGSIVVLITVACGLILLGVAIGAAL